MQISKRSAESTPVAVVLALLGVGLYFSALFLIVGIIYRRRLRDCTTRHRSNGADVENPQEPETTQNQNVVNNQTSVRYGDSQVQRPGLDSASPEAEQRGIEKPETETETKDEAKDGILNETACRKNGPGTSSAASSQTDSESALCTICLEGLQDDNNVRELPCGHIFHSSCIDRWRMQCPLCRARPAEEWIGLPQTAHVRY